MDDLLLHPATARALERVLLAKPSALALLGAPGTGKTAIARRLAADLLKLKPPALDTYPYFRLIEPDGASISIEAVRAAQHFLELKTIGTAAIRRVLIIEQAERLTLEAQNALLKTLEEPPADSVLILTLGQAGAILPTVASRLQMVSILPPPAAIAQVFFEQQGLESEKFQQLYHLAGGLPGLMSALWRDDATHPLLSAVSAAKTLLADTSFGRLAQVDVYAKQKTEAQAIVQALLRIADSGLLRAASSNKTVAATRWQNILQAAYRAQTALNAGAQTKLVFTDLLLAL